MLLPQAHLFGGLGSGLGGGLLRTGPLRLYLLGGEFRRGGLFLQADGLGDGLSLASLFFGDGLGLASLFFLGEPLGLLDRRLLRFDLVDALVADLSVVKAASKSFASGTGSMAHRGAVAGAPPLPTNP